MDLARPSALLDVEHPGLVWLISLTHGANEFFNLLLPPLFPFLVPDLGISYADASLLMVVFFATYSVFQLPAGRLVDATGARWLLVGGLVFLAAGTGLVALAPGLPAMLAGMTLAGVGGSAYHPTGMSVISDAESEATHGRSMGVHGMLGTLGSVAAPAVTTGVAVVAGWRAALLAGSAAGLAFAGVLFVAYPRVVPAEVRGESDGGFAGALGRPSPAAVRDGLARWLRFVASPGVAPLGLLFVVVGAEVRAVQTFTSVFAADAVGSDPAFGNAMLALTMVAAGVASAVAGYGVDRVDRRRFAAACFGATALAVVGVVVLPLGRGLLPIGFAVLGVVMYAIYPAANAMAAALSTRGRSGSLFAVTNTAAAVGSAGGPFLVGAVADAATLATGFLATAGIAVAGLAVVAVIGA